MITIGVIADTHIPDRMRHLHPGVLPIFREARVNAILHAGDVCVARILQDLEEIAPVFVVRGNRDWVRLGHLPFNRILTFEGVKIVLAHGHGGWREYLVDKVHYALFGMQPSRYRNRLLVSFPQAQVIVYGHLHAPYNDWIDGKLFFNPGSPSCPEKRLPPSVGLLHIRIGGEVEGEIIHLPC